MGPVTGDFLDNETSVLHALLELTREGVAFDDLEKKLVSDRPVDLDVLCGVLQRLESVNVRVQ